MSDESPTSAEDGNSAGACPKCGSTDIIQVPPILDEAILECQKCQTEFAPDGSTFESSEPAEKRVAEIGPETKKALASLQAVIDDALKTPFAEYVRQHKLGLLDSKFSKIDRLLDQGVLRA